MLFVVQNSVGVPSLIEYQSRVGARRRETGEVRIHGAPQDLEHFVIKKRKVYSSCKESRIFHQKITCVSNSAYIQTSEVAKVATFVTSRVQNILYPVISKFLITTSEERVINSS